MASVNKVFLVGNLGADPESKTFDNGGMVASFRIATTERWKDKNTGETKEQTDWHNISVRQVGLAKVVMDYVKKGTAVCVIGKLRNRQYEQNGEKKYITEIHADEIQILTPKGQNGGGGTSHSSSEPQFGGAPLSQPPAPIEDDLPF